MFEHREPSDGSSVPGLSKVRTRPEIHDNSAKPVLLTGLQRAGISKR